jgi:alpha-L-arabinofuranosidase
MKPYNTVVLIVVGLIGLAPSMPGADTSAETSVLHIQADQIVAPISPVFSGMMTEEINHSYDGGLYAELIQNRVFKDDATVLVHWAVRQSGEGLANIALDNANALNDQLPVCLRLEVSKAGGKNLAGVANDGYWGIPLRPHTAYRASFYAKAASGFNGSVLASLETSGGDRVFVRSTAQKVTGNWAKYSMTLTTPRSMKPTTDARFVLSLDAPGTVWFNLVSLFPPTWKNRPNGNRIDLMQTLADMQPKFLRFPGGNYLEGSAIANRFPWKETLGDLSQRPGHPGCWGYRSSDGMGLLEFLEWAEDLHSEPVLAVYAGYSLPPKSERVRPGSELVPYVINALEEIEYVIGETNTVWGARRAADGHPAPFKLHYVEIGNEDWFDRPASYDARFSQFYDAIKAKYPSLQCISTIGNEQHEKMVHSRKPDVLDEHYYWPAARFEHEAPTRFDKYERNGQKIFVGEWAAYEDVVPWDKKSRDLPPTPTFKAALGDAAWMTAMERNADIIVMQCYAPMLVNVNPGARQWRPNLIGYDGLGVFGSPSYYVIQMFNANRGDVVVKANLEPSPAASSEPLNYSVTKDSSQGLIYIKLVNADPASRPVRIDLDGVTQVKSWGSCVVLKSDSLDGCNTLAAPAKVAPVTKKISGLGRSFTQTLAPASVTVLQLQAR